MGVFPTPGPIDANVEIQMGTVHLIAGDRDDTTVVVNPTDPGRRLDVEAAEKTEVELAGPRLVVKEHHPRGVVGAVFGRYGSIEVTIELPQGSSVDVSNGLGDIRLDGRVAEARLKTGAGDIQADETTNVELISGLGDLRLGTARGEARLTSAGDIHVGHLEGGAVIKNTNGDTSIEEVTGHLRVKASNGDIAVSIAHSSVEARTATGSIEIGEVEAGNVTMQTAAGDLRLGVGAGTAAWIDAETKFGRVNNTLEATDRPDRTDRSVEIDAWTGFGDISLHRAGHEEN